MKTSLAGLLFTSTRLVSVTLEKQFLRLMSCGEPGSLVSQKIWTLLPRTCLSDVQSTKYNFLKLSIESWKFSKQQGIELFLPTLSLFYETSFKHLRQGDFGGLRWNGSCFGFCSFEKWYTSSTKIVHSCIEHFKTTHRVSQLQSTWLHCGQEICI